MNFLEVSSKSPAGGILAPDSRTAEIVRRSSGVSKPRSPTVVLRYMMSSAVKVLPYDDTKWEAARRDTLARLKTTIQNTR